MEHVASGSVGILVACRRAWLAVGVGDWDGIQEVVGSTPIGSTSPSARPDRYLALAQLNHGSRKLRTPALISQGSVQVLCGFPESRLADVVLRPPIVARPLTGAAKVVEVDDVVAPEHGLSAMPRPLHNRVRVNAGVDVVFHA